MEKMDGFPRNQGNSGDLGTRKKWNVLNVSHAETAVLPRRGM